jgi:hypothetical protein
MEQIVFHLQWLKSLLNARKVVVVNFATMQRHFFKLLHVRWVSESMHSRMVFNWAEDCLGNLINRLKDWHEIMLKIVDSCSEKIWD